MAPGWRFDPLATASALLAVLVLAGYVGLIRQQGDPPVPWYVAGLAGAAVLSGYGVRRAAPARRWALAGSGVVLAALGLLALLSIGLPLLVAGGLALVAAVRGRRRERTVASPAADPPGPDPAG